MPLSSEEQYLAELLDDFGVPGHPPVEEAFRIIEGRYNSLFAAIEASEPVVLTAVRKWNEHSYTHFALGIHGLLFDGLLNNAGKFRKASDGQGGQVWFGGQMRNEMRQQFAGSPPHLIESDVKAAFRLLIGAEDPIAASVLCYQQFQRVHPFYDANGRIGRLFTLHYLLAHGYYIQWGKLDKKHRKFLRLLNDVHKRPENDYSRPQYEGFLLNFWRKLVIPRQELEGDDADNP